MMARVYLGPVLQEVFTLPGLETADTWVDDIGADFGDRAWPRQCRGPEDLAIFTSMRDFHDKAGNVKGCPLCGVPCTWDHVLFDCEWWSAQPLETPGWFSQGKLEGPAALWTRGLVGLTESTAPARAWFSLRTLAAANGPRPCRALKKEGSDLLQVGSIVAQVPGRQTVFRGETCAVALLLKHTQGDLDLTGVEKRSRAAKPGKANADLWQQVQEGDPSRVCWHWVPSHKSEEDFIAACGTEHLWRRQANDLQMRCASGTLPPWRSQLG
eukprot:s3750_g6.t1